MELAAVDVDFLHGSSHRNAVLCSCGGTFFTVDAVERVDEVNAVAFFQVFKDRAFVFCKIQSVPADVRDIQPFRDAAFHAYNPAGNKAEAFVNAVLVAFLEEKLHAQADAHERLAFAGFFVNYFIKSGLEKLGGSIAESSHTGENQFVGISDNLRVSCNNRFAAHCSDGGGKRKEGKKGGGKKKKRREEALDWNG